jgi:LysM domain
MPDPNTTSQAALSTAMMAAFAMPEGAPLGAAYAALGFFVGIIWPDNSGQVPSQYRAVTAQDLDNVKTDLINAIKKALDDAQIKADSSKIFSYTSNLYDNFEQMMKVKIDPTGYQFINDSSGKDYVADADKYFDWLDPQSTFTLAQDILNDLNQSATSPSKTFGLYVLIGSLMVSYLKCAVTWSWGKEVRASLLYKDYWLALWDWNNKKTDAYRKAHPAEEPVKPDLFLSNPLPSWQDWRKEPGVAVDKLVATVNMLIKECEGDGKYAKLKANWDDRPSQVMSSFVKVSLKDDGKKPPDYYWVEGSGSGASSGPWVSCYKEATKALAMLEIMAGSQIAYTWQKYTDLYDLDGVKEEDIDNFYQTVSTWKQVRDTMLFQTANVDPADSVYPGNSLTDVARKYFYTDDALFYYVVKTNPSTLSDPALIVKDQVLIIPDLTGKNTPTSYTVQTGDTLASIAKAQLGDESHAINIFITNGQALKPKWIKTGETVGLPDLFDGSTFNTYTFRAADTWITFPTAAYSDQDLETRIVIANTNKVNVNLIMPYQVVKFPDLPVSPKLWYPPPPYDPDDPENPENPGNWGDGPF